MKVKIYLLTILALFSLQIAAAKPLEADSVQRNHLLVKFDLFYPIFYLIEGEKDDYRYVGAVEFKFKSGFSANLNGQIYYDPSIVQEGFVIMPEGRFYFNKHFIGIYIRYEKRERTDGPTYYSSDLGRIVEHVNIWGFGPLYGYQWKFGNLVVEPRIGMGIARNYYKHPKTQFDESGQTATDIYPNGVISLYIGWHIF